MGFEMKILKLRERNIHLTTSSFRLKHVMESRFINNKYTHVQLNNKIYIASHSTEGVVFVCRYPILEMELKASGDAQYRVSLCNTLTNKYTMTWLSFINDTWYYGEHIDSYVCFIHDSKPLTNY